MRLLRVALWPVGAALGVVAQRSAGLGDAIPDLVTGWTMLACGLVAWARRPESLAGPLLAAAGITWFAGNFFDAGLYWYRGPLVHLLLTYPDGRPRSSTERAAVAGGYAAAVVAPVWASEIAALALSALLPAVAARGRRLAAGNLRRARAVSLAATVAVSIAVAGGAAARLAYPAGDADDPALLALELVLCAVAVALAAGAVARPWERARLTDLVVELGETRSGTLRDALAQALGDPTLELGYWVPDAGAYADFDGRHVALPDAGSGRTATLVERDGVPLAVLVQDGGIRGDPALAASVAAAARMAESNARLQETVHSQLAELRASRRRILVAGFDERRRLEQRLQDGALRRLAELERTVRAAGASADGGALARIERAEGLLARARDDLDALGRGLHPRALTEHGLAGALALLADTSPVPVELSVPDEPLPAEIESAAYFVCAEALANAAKHARASRIVVAAARSEGRLRVEVADDGAGGADPHRGGGLRGLADRVEAAGGRLRIESPPGGGTRVSADLPAGGAA